jgi:hypothetical protein
VVRIISMGLTDHIWSVLIDCSDMLLGSMKIFEGKVEKIYKNKKM